MPRLFFLFFLFLLQHFLLRAQDTICSRKGDKIIAHVLEVGETVRFKRADIPEGPVYVMPRSEISTIRYANGARDIFPDPLPGPYSENNDFGLRKQSALVSGIAEPIEIQGHHYLYQGHHLSEKKLLKLASSNEPGEALRDEIEKVKRYKKNQYLSAICGGGMILLGSLLQLPAGFDQNTPQLSRLSLVGGAVAAVGTSFELGTISFKVKRRRHAKKVAELYNLSLSSD